VLVSSDVAVTNMKLIVCDVLVLDSSGRDLHASFVSHIIHHLTYMTGLSDHTVSQSLLVCSLCAIAAVFKLF